MHLASSEEPNNVLVATRAIMCLVLDDSEEIPTQLLEVLLQNVLNAKKVRCILNTYMPVFSYHVYANVAFLYLLYVNCPVEIGFQMCT